MLATRVMHASAKGRRRAIPEEPNHRRCMRSLSRKPFDPFPLQGGLASSCRDRIYAERNVSDDLERTSCQV